MSSPALLRNFTQPCSRITPPSTAPTGSIHSSRSSARSASPSSCTRTRASACRSSCHRRCSRAASRSRSSASSPSSSRTAAAPASSRSAACLCLSRAASTASSSASTVSRPTQAVGDGQAPHQQAQPRLYRNAVGPQPSACRAGSHAEQPDATLREPEVADAEIPEYLRPPRPASSPASSPVRERASATWRDGIRAPNCAAARKRRIDAMLGAARDAAALSSSGGNDDVPKVTAEVCRCEWHLRNDLGRDPGLACWTGTTARGSAARAHLSSGKGRAGRDLAAGDTETHAIEGISGDFRDRNTCRNGIFYTFRNEAHSRVSLSDFGAVPPEPVSP